MWILFSALCPSLHNKYYEISATKNDSLKIGLNCYIDLNNKKHTVTVNIMKSLGSQMQISVQYIFVCHERIVIPNYENDSLWLA